jgi:hypothetical protein
MARKDWQDAQEESVSQPTPTATAEAVTETQGNQTSVIQAEADLKAAQSLAGEAAKIIEAVKDSRPERIKEAFEYIGGMSGNIAEDKPSVEFFTYEMFIENLKSYDPLNEFRPNLFCKKVSFPEGAMSVVGARTGRGKTTALVNLAIDAIDNGRKCLFINLETPNVQLFYKLILLRAYKNAPGHVKADTFDKIENPTTELCKVRKNQNNASNEKFLVNYDFESYARNAIDYVGDYVGSGQLMFPKDIGLSQQDIIELISRQEKGSVILIDYLQRVPSDEKSADGYLKVKQISNAILQASLESEVVTICGAQFNRTAGTNSDGDDNFDDASFRESADIEQDAHIAIGIGRKKDRKSRFVEILKSRQAAVTGNRHEMECNLAYSYMKMTEKVINIDQRKFKLHDEKGRFMKNPAETTVETQQLAD